MFLRVEVKEVEVDEENGMEVVKIWGEVGGGRKRQDRGRGKYGSAMCGKEKEKKRAQIILFNLFIRYSKKTWGCRKKLSVNSELTFPLLPFYLILLFRTEHASVAGLNLVVYSCILVITNCTLYQHKNIKLSFFIVPHYRSQHHC